MSSRRDVVRALGAGLLAVPFRSIAQQSGRVWRVAFLAPADSDTRPGEISPYGMAFIREMQAAGLTMGAHYAVEARSAGGDYEKLPALAAELVAQKVDILVPISPVAVVAAREATASIPIVCIGVHDPVGMKMVSSLSRPGGNMTGVASFYGELIPKHFELARSILPKVSRIAILANVGRESDHTAIEKMLEIGRKMGLRLQHVHGTSREEIGRAFAEMKREGAGAMIGVADAALMSQRKLVADLAIKQRLPSIFANRENVQAGGLASYGEDFVESFGQAAKYVARIIKGARPGDLAIEQPSKFSLVLNRATAKTLGVTLGQELLLRADEVIG